MSTMFIFVLALFVGPNDALPGSMDVVFTERFETMTACETKLKGVKEADTKGELELACLAIAKPGVYKDRDEI